MIEIIEKKLIIEKKVLNFVIPNEINLTYSCMSWLGVHYRRSSQTSQIPRCLDALS